MPTPITEETPILDPPFDPATASYGELKAEAERAVQSVLGDRALLARAGLVLRPHEPAGRLIWWLRRMAAGGDVLAPGPPNLPLQYVDVRDLARWLVDAAMRAVYGTLNAVSAPGHTTMAAHCWRRVGTSPVPRPG